LNSESLSKLELHVFRGQRQFRAGPIARLAAGVSSGRWNIKKLVLRGAPKLLLKVQGEIYERDYLSSVQPFSGIRDVTAQWRFGDPWWQKNAPMRLRTKGSPRRPKQHDETSSAGRA
jgi:hypothetical protein